MASGGVSYMGINLNSVKIPANFMLENFAAIDVEYMDLHSWMSRISCMFSSLTNVRCEKVGNPMRILLLLLAYAFKYEKNQCVVNFFFS